MDVSFHVDKGICRVFGEYPVEVEHAGSQIQAEGQRQYDGNWCKCLLDKGIGPGDGNKVILVPIREFGVELLVTQFHVPDVSLVVDIDEVVHRIDSLEQGELEDPPDKDLHAKKHVSQDGYDGGNHHYGKRNPAEDHVAVWYALAVSLEGESLEDGKQQQKGREDYVQQAVGDERYA